MLTKETVVDKQELLEDGTLQVRRASYILEDGVRIAGPMYHRVVYAPGQDISHEDQKVTALAAAAWTKDVVRAYNKKAAIRAAPPSEG